MNKTLIKSDLEKIISEVNVSGEKITKKAQNTSKTQNDSYLKDVEKKMKDYDKSSKQDDEDKIDPKKTNVEGDTKEYHDDMEIMNGQEMIQYSQDPNKQFKDRAKKAIEGDATMGNDPTWANVIPADQQGFTGPDFGKNLVKTINNSKKKRDKSNPDSTMFGDDIEFNEGSNKKRRKVATESMKRIKFKKPFNGVGNALKLIPEAFKVDKKKFELTDGVEKYKIEWNGSLNEGRANIIEATSKDLVNEDFYKIKHLMGYKSEATLGSLNSNDRVNENSRLIDNFRGTKDNK